MDLQLKKSDNFSLSILCRFFVFYGVRFNLNFSWPIRFISILTSCAFNLFKANRLVALYLSIERKNYALRIIQILQLLFDIWLYFYLLFNQDKISDHLDNIFVNLAKQAKIILKQKLKFYRIVYLIFLLETLRLSIFWYLSGTKNLYETEFPYLDKSTIDNALGHSQLLIEFLISISLFNKLLNTMLFTLSIFLYIFIYYSQHLQCFVLSEQCGLYSNLIEFKSKYRILQKQSIQSNQIVGTLPFIWFLHLIFMSTVRMVHSLNSKENKNYVNPIMFCVLFMKLLMTMSISLYLAQVDTLNKNYIQNMNQKIVDRIYSGSNYFELTALLHEISIPIESPIIWTMFRFDRTFLFRYCFLLIITVIVCCQYEIYKSKTKEDNTEGKGFLKIDYDVDERGRFGGIYEKDLNKALDLMLIVLKNYTFANSKYVINPEELDHGFYNDTTKQYDGTLGMVQRGEVDMIFPILIPSQILDEGFAATYPMEESQLVLGTLTKTFKYKKLPLIYILNALDTITWTLLAIASMLILFLNIYIRFFLNLPKINNALIFFVQKLIINPLDYNEHTQLKIVFLLISSLIIRHVVFVIFPNCLSSDYITLDKSNLVTTISDLLDENTIALTSNFDGTIDFIKKTQLQRKCFDKLWKKLIDCGPMCLIETLLRQNFDTIFTGSTSRLSMIATSELNTLLLASLSWVLKDKVMIDAIDDMASFDFDKELLLSEVRIENSERTYAWAISSHISQSKLHEINLFSTKMMQNQILDSLYTHMVDQYAPLRARLILTYDNQDITASGDTSNHFVMKFAYFNSAFYTLITVDLIVCVLFFLSKFHKFNRIKDNENV